MVSIEVNGIWSNKKKKEQSAANDQIPHTHHHFSAEWTIMTVSDQTEYVD